MHDNKPTTVTCHNCGSSFNPESASLHKSKCLNLSRKKYSIFPGNVNSSQAKQSPSLTKLLRYKIKISEKGCPERKAWIHLKRQLKHCELCGKSYVPEKITLDFQNHRQSFNLNQTTDSPIENCKVLICYICGETFDSKALYIHEIKCLKNFTDKNIGVKIMQKPEKPGKKSLIEERNRLAYESAQSQFIPCKNCGRTFFPDRLMVHQRSCAPTGKTVSPRPGSVSPRSSASPSGYVPKVETESSPFFLRPRFIICYICGREFGSKSISIHEPQCLKKWEIENANLPKSLRRPKPVKPTLIAIPGGSSGGSKIKGAEGGTYNIQQEPQPFVPANMIACPICKRTFLPDRLMVHQRSCKPPSMKPVPKTSHRTYN